MIRRAGQVSRVPCVSEKWAGFYRSRSIAGGVPVVWLARSSSLGPEAYMWDGGTPVPVVRNFSKDSRRDLLRHGAAVVHVKCEARHWEHLGPSQGLGRHEEERGHIRRRSQWADVSVTPMMVNGGWVRRLTPTRSVGEVSTWLRVTVPHEILGRWDSSSRFAALASRNSGEVLLGTRVIERGKKRKEVR
jgi:hypothetical protein